MLLALLLVSFQGMAAFAEIETLDVDDRMNMTTFSRITAFTGELPEALEEALMSGGFAGYDCYAGAMLQQLSKLEYMDTAGSIAWALVAMEKDGRRELVGLTRDNKDPWSVSKLGAKALLPEREFTVTLSDAHSRGDKLPTRFSVAYPREDGGSEAYGMWIQYGGSTWNAVSYESVDAQGKGIAIVNDFNNWFEIWSLSAGKNASGPSYPAYLPLSLEHMDSILDYPTNEADAKRLAEASWARFAGTDLAMAWGEVNFREEPSMEARILGKTKTGVLVHAIGLENGNIAPWIHVRLGREEGWISGTYVSFPQENSHDFARIFRPLPVARATEDRILRAGPQDDAEAVEELPKDTLMHVLAETEGGWLYVMLPRGEIGWEMDVDGVCGYVAADEVSVGASAGAVMAVDIP